MSLQRKSHKAKEVKVTDRMGGWIGPSWRLFDSTDHSHSYYGGSCSGTRAGGTIAKHRTTTFSSCWCVPNVAQATRSFDASLHVFVRPCHYCCLQCSANLLCYARSCSRSHEGCERNYWTYRCCYFRSINVHSIAPCFYKISTQRSFFY